MSNSNNDDDNDDYSEGTSNRCWFTFYWSARDNLLVEQWRRNRGKSGILFIDESKPDPLADELPAPIPFEISGNNNNNRFKPMETEYAFNLLVDKPKRKKALVKRKKFNKRERETIFNYNQSMCASCNNINRTLLQIDHVDGNAENNELSNLQLLCYHCHKLKHKAKRRSVI